MSASKLLVTDAAAGCAKVEGIVLRVGYGVKWQGDAPTKANTFKF